MLITDGTTGKKTNVIIATEMKILKFFGFDRRKSSLPIQETRLNPPSKKRARYLISRAVEYRNRMLTQVTYIHTLKGLTQMVTAFFSC